MRSDVCYDGPEVPAESDSILFCVILLRYQYIYGFLAPLKSALPTCAEPAYPGDQADGASLFNLRLSYI